MGEIPTAGTTPPTTGRRAFVTYLMSNDSYLPGCLMTAYGLRRQGSQSRRACLVTPEITARARSALAILFDEVVEVQPIAPPGEAERRLSPGETERTGSARVRSASLTRFASLRLGPDGDLGCSYERVIALDADLLPMRDYERLWELEPPAGIVNERRSHMAEIDASGQLVVRPDIVERAEWVWHRTYAHICPHGTPVPAEITDRVAADTTNYGINGSLVVLRPSMEEYDRFLRWAARPDIATLIEEGWPWTDQQAATLYWSGQWTSIDVSYSTLYGYPSLELARGLHFAGIKPWSWRKKGSSRRIRRFPDYRLWRDVYLEMLDEHPQLRSFAALARLERAVRSVDNFTDRVP